MPLIAYKIVREGGTSASDEAMDTDAGDLRRDLEARGYRVLNIAGKKPVCVAAEESQKISSSEMGARLK